VLQPRSLSDHRGRNMRLGRRPRARSKALWLIIARRLLCADVRGTGYTEGGGGTRRLRPWQSHVPTVRTCWNRAFASSKSTASSCIPRLSPSMESGQPSARRTSITAASCSVTRSTPLCSDTARDLEERFEEDRKVAKEIDIEIWREGPLRDRIGDFIQRTGQSLEPRRMGSGPIPATLSRGRCRSAG
jgi:hypothetical protein